jgi:hypothetical protein
MRFWNDRISFFKEKYNDRGFDMYAIYLYIYEFDDKIAQDKNRDV